MSWPRVLVLRSMASSARSALDRVEIRGAQEVRPVEQRLQRAAQLVGDGGEELVLHAARALRLRPHLVLVREQPHVVDRDARVLREQVQDGLAAVGEGSRRPPVHVEETLHPALHHDRHDQGRDERLDLDPGIVVPGDPGIPPDVVAAERLAGLQHEAARAAPGLDDQAVLEPAVLAGPVTHDDRAGIGLAQGHAGEVAAAQLLGPVDHALEHGAHVVGRVDRPRQLGEHLRLAAAPARLDEEGRVVHRHRGLDREPLEGGEVLSGKWVAVRAARQHQHPEQAPAAHQGHRHRVANPEPHHRGQRVGRIRVVVAEQAVPGRRAARHETAGGRERGLLRGLAPAPGAAERVAVLVHQVREAAPLEELPGALDDQVEEPVQVELRAQVALHRREGLELRAPCGLEREQARVLQRDGGLVGEVLQSPDLVGAERAAGGVTDREHAGHPARDGERHREHRAVPGAFHPRPRLRIQRHARVGQDVRRRDRGALAHREPGDRLVDRDDGAGGEGPARTGGGHRHEARGERVELPQDGHAAAQQGPDPLRDVPAHARAVERLHEDPPYRRQRGRVASRRLFAHDHHRLVALDAAPLGEIAEHQHRADHAPGRVPHRGAALVDRPLLAVVTDQQRARPAGEAAVPHHPRHRALDRLAALLADQRARLAEPAAARLVGATAGEVLGGRVHEGDAPGRVGDHHRVADAGERDRELFPLVADARLGAPAARGRRADPGRDHQEEKRAHRVVAVRRHREQALPEGGQAGRQEAGAGPAVPGAQDDGGQEQEELGAIGQG